MVETQVLLRRASRAFGAPLPKRGWYGEIRTDKRIESGTRIAIFAKAPEPGEVKTRLISSLGAYGAAALYRELVLRAIRTAVQADIGAVQLWCAGDPRHPFFVGCVTQFGVQAVAQQGGDLGERMHRALEALLCDSGRALIIGCDIPAMTADYLRAADAALRRGADAVIGPAEDGGYVLIGLSRAEAALFRDIGWGGPQVLAVTRSRLAQAGLRHCELPLLWDVDRPEDLQRGELPELLAGIGLGSAGLAPAQT